VEPTGGRFVDWVLTWHRDDLEPSLVGLQPATLGAPLFVAGGLLFLLMAAALHAREMTLGARFGCVLLGAVMLLAGLAGMRRSAIRLDRGRFEWTAVFRSRAASTDDLIGFYVEKREETEGAVSWVLVARVGPQGRMALSSAATRPEVQPLCDVLNEALFVVKATPPQTSGPYR
jgi:hypothetical protein